MDAALLRRTTPATSLTGSKSVPRLRMKRWHAHIAVSPVSVGEAYGRVTSSLSWVWACWP